MKAKKGNHLITCERAGINFKVCRVVFGKDGSYYVTSPYHKAKTALLFKATINYALQEQSIGPEETIDLASSEDEEARIKFTHHPDGFVQYSGPNILSGRNKETGEIKGIGVMSYPITRPVRGPSFGIQFTGINEFEQVALHDNPSVTFHAENLIVPQSKPLFSLEGHVLPKNWKRFVQRDQYGKYRIGVIHPAGAMISMLAIFPPDDWALPYFIALEFYALPAADDCPEHSFTFGGPTGNLRRNVSGELLGDAVVCSYPRGTSLPDRSRKFSMRSLDYVLPPMDQK